MSLNTQKYKLAATGAGVIVCQRLSATSFRALLSLRTDEVGAGLGITGGGFVENGDIFKQHPGFVIETAAEAWRETMEENMGFGSVIRLPTFLKRAQSIATMHVRVDDENGVHGTNFYALTVTDDEWSRIANLSPGPERSGSLQEVWCHLTGSVSRLDPEVNIALVQPDGSLYDMEFYHQHERRAFGHIAWHVQEGLLWPPASRQLGE